MVCIYNLKEQKKKEINIKKVNNQVKKWNIDSNRSSQML